MGEFKQEFLKECQKNREYLEFSAKDMANCLIGVSEEDYLDFESGKKGLSKDNIQRLIRVLCIKSPKQFNLDDYIDTKGMSEEELEDFSMVIKMIVGDEND